MKKVKKLNDTQRNEALAVVAFAGVLGVAASMVPPVLLLGFDPRAPEWWRWVYDYSIQMGTPPTEFLYGLALGVAVFLVGAILNPFSMARLEHGFAKFASAAEIRKMKPRLTARRGMVFGRAFGKLLTSDAPLSAMVAAPAGTGKTENVIVPSVLMSDDSSLVINDPKGEIFDKTAGYRAKRGPVFRLDPRAGAAGSNCYNPLGLNDLPQDGAARGDLIDRMVTMLIEGKESDFFVSAPRAGLSAWMLYCIYEAGEKGLSATLGDIAARFGKLGSEIDDDEIQDPVRAILEVYAAYAREMGWPPRIETGLLQLAQFDYRTRSNIVGSVNTALRLFLNENVAAITATSDFSIHDLRGLDGKPVSVYVVVPAFDQETFGKLTGLFVECATRSLTERQPDKKALGVRFILDEVAFMPPVQAISMGPAITRGYGVSFLFAFQDFGQIKGKWGESGLDNMRSNTAFKVVFAQNHQDTAKYFEDLVGEYTRQKESASEQVGLGAKLFKGKSASLQYEGKSLLTAQDVKNLKMGEVIVLAQGNLARPIHAKGAFAPKIARLRRRLNLKTPALRATARPAMEESGVAA